MIWRLLSDGEHTAAWNMALDQAILEAVVDGIAPPTFRIYGWSEIAVSVGRFQNVVRDVNGTACRALQIPIVRRPTGGRGILHGGDITLSLALPTAVLGLQNSRSTYIYQRLSAGCVAAFNALGLPIEQCGTEGAAVRSGDCFQTRSSADMISLDGFKLVGSALFRSHCALLQQSSIRHRRVFVEASRVFWGSRGEEYYPIEHVEREEVVEALVSGFAAELGIGMYTGSVSAWEEERAAALLRTITVS